MGLSKWGTFTAAFFYALTATAAPLTLKQAVTTALESNPSLRKSREAAVESDSAVSLAYSQAFPTVNAIGALAYRKDSLFLTNSLFGGQPYNFYSVGLQAQQPIFHGGALLGGLSLAKRRSELSGVQVKIGERNLTEQVVQAYFGLLLAERSLQIIKQTEEIYVGYQKLAERRLSTGRSEKLDVLQIRTQLALLKPKVLQGENDLRLAAVTLASLLGQRESPSIEVQGRLTPPDWEPLLKHAAESEEAPLEVQQAELDRERLSSQRRVTLSKHWPQLDAIGNINSIATEKSRLMDQSGRSWTVGLQVTVPLFSGLSSVFERRVLAAQEAQLEAEEARVRDLAALGQVRTTRDLELSKALIEASKSAFDRAKEAADMARGRYALGTVNFIQLFETSRNLVEAETSYNQASIACIFNLIAYFNARGWSLDPLVAALDKSSAP